MPDDRELLSKWRAGDRTAGSQLFDRHFASLRRFFRNKVPIGEVEDLMQRTLVSCVESVGRFRGDSSFRTYLFVIARRELYDHLGRRFRAEAREAPDMTVTSLCDLGVTPSVAVAALEQHAIIASAMQRIPVDFQVTLELFYWEQLQGPELAEVLGISPTTVRTRLHRARKALREALEALCPGLPAEDDALDRSVTALGEHL